MFTSNKIEVNNFIITNIRFLINVTEQNTTLLYGSQLAQLQVIEKCISRSTE